MLDQFTFCDTISMKIINCHYNDVIIWQHLAVRTFSMSVVSRGAGLEVASGRVPAPSPCVWSGEAKWGQSHLCVGARVCVCVCVCVEGVGN